MGIICYINPDMNLDLGMGAPRRGFKAIARFLMLLIIGANAAFALQIEALKEIEEHVLAYSIEAGATDRDAILRVGIVKNADCDAFSIKLIDKSNGKAVKEIERCIGEFPNAALQDGILEIFGHPVKREIELSDNAKTALLGIGFAATGLLLYYSKPPKPARGPVRNKISEVAE